jgi:hypothetical protein
MGVDGREGGGSVFWFELPDAGDDGPDADRRDPRDG